MAYDETTADRIRSLLRGHPNVDEKPMIGGGLAFMVGGYLCCGATTKGLTVRVGQVDRIEALTRPHTHPLVIGGREAAAFVVVEPEGYRTDEMLQTWVEWGLGFVATLSQD